MNYIESAMRESLRLYRAREALFGLHGDDVGEVIPADEAEALRTELLRVSARRSGGTEAAHRGSPAWAEEEVLQGAAADLPGGAALRPAITVRAVGDETARMRETLGGATPSADGFTEDEAALRRLSRALERDARRCDGGFAQE